jgi:hypothetical protein
MNNNNNDKKLDTRSKTINSMNNNLKLANGTLASEGGVANTHNTASIPKSKAIKAEVIYVNADTQKSSIFINNKGKSGIYR